LESIVFTIVLQRIVLDEIVFMSICICIRKFLKVFVFVLYLIQVRTLIFLFQARSPRAAFSSIESLLMSHNLQQYTEALQSNGYDDPHFLADVSERELQDIGVAIPSDREKVLGMVGKGLLRLLHNYSKPRLQLNF